jgi:hypothetical protein
LQCDLSEEGIYELSRLGVVEPSQMKAGDGNWYPMPLASITMDGVTHVLRRHPKLYNMKHIDEWIQEYRYTEQYKVPVPYEERSPLWIQAKNVYEYYYNGAVEWQTKQLNKK